MLIAQKAHSSDENQILSALPTEEYDRLSTHLEPVYLPHGQTLYAPDSTIEYVHFPMGAMISLVSQLSDGASIEVGVTGFEGMTGISIVLGVNKSPHQGVVQIPGNAMRMKAEVLKNEFNLGGKLQDLLLRYTQSLMLQISHVAACGRLHHVDERLARWLLMSADRCGCSELPLTHEFIAQMLGVRRAGVTTAALALQSSGLIHYRRGRISILDRQGMEGIACECYSILKAEFDNILNGRKERVEVSVKPNLQHQTKHPNLHLASTVEAG